MHMSRTSNRPSGRGLRAAVSASGLVLLLAACGSSGGTPTDGSNEAVVNGTAAPTIDAIADGTMTWCVDLSFPPSGYTGNDGVTPKGFDVEIAREISGRLGVEYEINNVVFDGIIPALQANKCQGIISAMGDTEKRRATVDFVDYLQVGNALLVKSGNPAGITGLAGLCGHSVVVELGTTMKTDVEDRSKECTADDKAPIKIKVMSQANDSFRELALGRVDAYYQFSLSSAYRMSQEENKGKYEIAGELTSPAPLGIATAKNNSDLHEAIQQAVDDMLADGTMQKIVDDAGLADFVSPDVPQSKS